MSNDQVIALRSIVTDRGCSIVYDKHVFRKDKVKFVLTHFLLNTGKCIIHALAECQIVLGARHDYSHAEHFCRRSLCCRCFRRSLCRCLCRCLCGWSFSSCSCWCGGLSRRGTTTSAQYH